MVYVKKDVFVKKMEGNANMRLLASRQLGHCFNSYAQSFNRSYDRTGGLFQKPFKRKYVEDKNYFNTLVMYIHNNPKTSRICWTISKNGLSRLITKY
jgi:hypothetical protein